MDLNSGIRSTLQRYHDDRVIYAFVVEGRRVYIGVCEKDTTTLRARMGRYQSMAGASTNKSNAHRIRRCLEGGRTVEIHAAKPAANARYADICIDLVKGLENPLIEKFKPEWNGATEREQVEDS